MVDNFNDRSFFLLISVDNFASSVSLDSLGRESVLPLSNGSELDNSGVDSTSDTVLHFDVKLRNDVGFEGSIFLKIFLGRGINDVTNGETLDSFIFGTKSSAVDADDVLDVPSVVFVSSVISTFDRHVVNYIRIYLLN